MGLVEVGVVGIADFVVVLGGSVSETVVVSAVEDEFSVVGSVLGTEKAASRTQWVVSGGIDGPGANVGSGIARGRDDGLPISMVLYATLDITPIAKTRGPSSMIHCLIDFRSANDRKTLEIFVVTGADFLWEVGDTCLFTSRFTPLFSTLFYNRTGIF